MGTPRSPRPGRRSSRHAYTDAEGHEYGPDQAELHPGRLLVLELQARPLVLELADQGAPGRHARPAALDQQGQGELTPPRPRPRAARAAPRAGRRPW